MTHVCTKIADLVWNQYRSLRNFRTRDIMVKPLCNINNFVVLCKYQNYKSCKNNCKNCFHSV